MVIHLHLMRILRRISHLHYLSLIIVTNAQRAKLTQRDS